MIDTGQVSVTPVIDSVVRLDPTKAHENTSPVDWSRHAELLDDDGLLQLTRAGYVVRSRDRVIRIDEGVAPAGAGASLVVRADITPPAAGLKG